MTTIPLSELLHPGAGIFRQGSLCSSDNPQGTRPFPLAPRQICRSFESHTGRNSHRPRGRQASSISPYLSHHLPFDPLILRRGGMGCQNILSICIYECVDSNHPTDFCFSIFRTDTLTAVSIVLQIGSICSKSMGNRLSKLVPLPRAIGCPFAQWPVVPAMPTVRG